MRWVIGFGGGWCLPFIVGLGASCALRIQVRQVAGQSRLPVLNSQSRKLSVSRSRLTSGALVAAHARSSWVIWKSAGQRLRGGGAFFLLPDSVSESEYEYEWADSADFSMTVNDGWLDALSFALCSACFLRLYSRRSSSLRILRYCWKLTMR